ncbi:hypothetical protein PRIPAC_90832 [Pristionchus pacificus]|uniref:Uncharacterized protein n=1 Tax=Pristionchus pacificus TaxID=54126 RepID=A0A2A6B642_PRIPA|nr:hypothetical protein PRIPAC_90832 [Pristionchus pacificus]|eukprot:PDM61328.1 hypothetical protein PRIPAC_50770 [Pristionchus pacificus]
MEKRRIAEEKAYDGKRRGRGGEGVMKRRKKRPEVHSFFVVVEGRNETSSSSFFESLRKVVGNARETRPRAEKRVGNSHCECDREEEEKREVSLEGRLEREFHLSFTLPEDRIDSFYRERDDDDHNCKENSVKKMNIPFNWKETRNRYREGVKLMVEGTIMGWKERKGTKGMDMEGKQKTSTMIK